MKINRGILALGVLGLVLTMAITLTGSALAQVPTPVAETASVTVNEVISFTVTDNGSDGINFGSVNAGAGQAGEAAQSASNGAVTLIVGAETNTDLSVEVAGSGDFADGSGGTIALGQALWNTEYMPDDTRMMSTTYQQVGQSTAGNASTIQVWHWLGVPSTATSGTYTTTFYYRVDNTP